MLFQITSFVEGFWTELARMGTTGIMNTLHMVDQLTLGGKTSLATTTLIILGTFECSELVMQIFLMFTKF